MAGRGPAPKDPSQRMRRNTEPEILVVKDDGKVHGDPLPDSVDWPDATVTWWETWRRSPQAQMFTATDWSFLLDTAMVHMAMWDGDLKAAGELRQRVAKFGATPEDRARLRLNIGGTEPAPIVRERKPAARTRRARLLKAVGDDD